MCEGVSWDDAVRFEVKREAKMRRNTIASGVLNVAFAAGLVSILAIMVMHALKGGKKDWIHLRR